MWLVGWVDGLVGRWFGGWVVCWVGGLVGGWVGGRGGLVSAWVGWWVECVDEFVVLLVVG